jgi:hypothetical protein
MKRTFTFATLLALAAAAYAPLPSMAQASYSVVISSAPPAPLYERVPAPRAGYAWAPGHWEWRGHRHEWVQGFWIEERPGYAYTAPAWMRGERGWYMEPARWTPYGRDRDRDGIPDRMEYRGHDRDHDGVPDRVERRWEHERWERERWERERREHDRDGDGVPNRYDRAPDNWRRN